MLGAVQYVNKMCKTRIYATVHTLKSDGNYLLTDTHKKLNAVYVE